MQLLTTAVVASLSLAFVTCRPQAELQSIFEETNFQRCFSYNDYNSNTFMVPECSRYMVRVGHNLNLNQNEMKNLVELVENSTALYMESSRSKRRARGLRIRRECRTLSDRERDRLFGAIRQMKQGADNIYDTLAKIHLSAETLANAHMGSNFPGWHRLYVYFFENALRRFYPNGALCYWDPTLDYLMPGADQLHSVTFTDQCFGNGYGTVINGPYRNWELVVPYNYRLRRNIGQGGSLTRPQVVDIIAFNRRVKRSTQILTGSGSVGFPDPDTGRKHSLEQCHDNTHVYVGELFSSLPVTAQDPIFWHFHCYLDYVWELFRTKQRRMGINPAKDYPEHGGADHSAQQRMVPFFNFRNIDGYSNIFTDRIYRYAPHPTCGNRCGGAPKRLLYCPRGGHRRSRCVSRAVNRDVVPRRVLSEVDNPILEGFVKNGMASQAVLSALAFEVSKKDGPLNYPEPNFTPSFIDERVAIDTGHDRHV